MNILTVSFFGHRIINNAKNVEKTVEKLILELLRENEYVEFLIGRNGEFDTLASSCIRRMKKHYRQDNSALILVMPYETSELRENINSFSEYYDDIQIYPFQTHYKSAIQSRNKWMIERSQLIIFLYSKGRRRGFFIL